jgi:hypothetical protein
MAYAMTLRRHFCEYSAIDDDDDDDDDDDSSSR